MKDLRAKWKAENLEQSVLSLLREVVDFTAHIKLLSQGRCYGCNTPAMYAGHEMTAEGSFYHFR